MLVNVRDSVVPLRKGEVMSGGNPLVSVVMPVHNGAEWLPAALDGVLAQTMGDFELVAVDDGSTDAVPQVLAAYAARDPRVRVLTHATPQGAGAARNAGLDAAQGAYLLFLDADDLFEPELLERAVEEARRSGADMVLLGADEFEVEGAWRANGFYLAAGLLPADVPFCRDDVPTRLFQLCTPEPWTKLFRRSFVLEHGLRFQQLQNTNDLLFTLSGLALARRVGVARDVLVHHRVGRAGGIQASRSRDPLAFLEALRALRARLELEGLLGQLGESYANLAVFHCLFNDDAPADWPRVFAELGVAGLPRGRYWIAGDYVRVVRLVSEFWQEGASPADAYDANFWRTAALMWRGDCRSGEQRLQHTALQVEEAWAEVGRVKSSASFRLGRAMTAPLRKLRGDRD